MTIQNTTAAPAEASLPAEFLELILPRDGVLCAVHFTRGADGKQRAEHDWCRSPAELVERLLYWSRQGCETYHACASYRAAGDRWAGRKQANVSAVKAFWLDIDCGEGKPYADIRAAVMALAAFLHATGLPTPSVICSGVGLHIYWPLAESMTPDKWRTAARALQKLCEAQGLAVDPSRTADHSSILRTPGTLNYKREAPAPVHVRGKLAGPYANDLILSKLLPPADSLPNVEIGSTYAGDSVSASAVQIAERCPQLAIFRDACGNIPEPTWYAGLTILARCTEGEGLAQQWSTGHDEYSGEATTQKFEHAKAAPGPTTCAQFERLNPELCNTCQNKGKVKSPIVLGMVASSTSTAPTVEGEDGDGRGPSQKARLVAIGRRATLWHDEDREAYASVEIGGHVENHPVAGEQFRRHLRRTYGDAYPERGPGGDLIPSTPSDNAIGEAISTLVAFADRGEEHKPHVRVAGHAGRVYLDLGRDDWSAVEIDAAGWRVVAAPPVKFLRPSGMRPLPMPVSGGRADELRPFINVADDAEFKVVVGWLLMCLHPKGPYPLLALSGEAASGKSTITAVLRQLVDPNKAPLRSISKDEEDLLIAARNSRIVAFDNLSGISPAMADNLCKLATGAGLSKRKLYSDLDEIIVSVCRPCIINGIDDLTQRGDLASRAVVVHPPELDPKKRVEEIRFWAQFEQATPRILGALLDAASCALRCKDGLKLGPLPRMADFVRWVEAAAPALGWKLGQFSAAYDNSRRLASDIAVEGDAVGNAVVALLDKKEGHWEGTASGLLADLNQLTLTEAVRGNRWPSSPSHLSKKIRRLAPDLRQLGISVDYDREGKERTRKVCLHRNA